MRPNSSLFTTPRVSYPGHRRVDHARWRPLQICLIFNEAVTIYPSSEGRARDVVQRCCCSFVARFGGRWSLNPRGRIQPSNSLLASLARSSSRVDLTRLQLFSIRSRLPAAGNDYRVVWWSQQCQEGRSHLAPRAARQGRGLFAKSPDGKKRSGRPRIIKYSLCSRLAALARSSREGMMVKCFVPLNLELPRRLQDGEKKRFFDQNPLLLPVAV